ncbi:TrlF family AAA-like ATPase [Methanohalophilus portucalensis]|uniref:DNA repair ATPase n=2 Tax=Methanohalophilus portucalensis TaxID=39664 RepID=A0A1X7P1T3_9EURY|nr:hypothetical protein [Methanohalophilus portucalensis]ATU08061.1 hypothetical protein BKM01_04280 [Methanohalophilus portucalensis]RNI10038.1 hypothetical protein EFE41_08230 [Methanohalophilus portucalensis FDF-1]SMH44591.1 hypothetical protein SAMN06264941_2101 [Methanohalophilus portucalensis FDF-1]
MSEFPKGSEWTKWDLHIHTPESIINDYGNSADVWEKFLKDLEALPEEFKVIGINDYLFLDGYKKIKYEKEINGRLSNIKLILPVVEFRIQKFAGVEFRNTKRINLHVIFSNELDINTIESQFLNALEQSYKLSSDINRDYWNGSITKESLKDLGKKIKSNVPDKELPKYQSDLIEGFNNLNLDEKKIFEILKNRHYFKDKYLIAVGKTEWDELQWSNSSVTDKKTIINNAHLVFTSAKSVEKYVNAREKLSKEEVNDLLLDCSDAHTYSYKDTTKDRIGNCFNWIKANPTFEGLRQIIFEGSERVRVQEGNPQEDFKKSFFSEINITNTNIFNHSEVKFDETKLELSQNLVTIIGGRGKGKSLLLDSIAKTFNKFQENGREREISIPNDKFTVTYQKTDGTTNEYHIQNENNLDYLHIHQGEVKEIVDPQNSYKLDDEIKKLLNLTNEADSLDVPESEIERLINEIFEIKNWFNYKDSNGNYLNSYDYNRKKKKEKEDLIKTITTEENRQLIDKYIGNLNKINKISEQSTKAQQVLNNLLHFQDQINNDIQILNEYSDIVEDKIPQLNIQTQRLSINNFLANAKTQIATLQDDNFEIDTKFKDAGIKTDISGLLEQISIYQDEIDTYNRRIKEIDLKNEDIEYKYTRLKELADLIEQAHEKCIENINSKWIQLKSGKNYWNEEQKKLIADLLDDIEIKAHEVFNSNEFYNQILGCLNLRKFRETQLQSKNEKIEEIFQIKSKDDYLKLLRGEKIVYLDGNYLNLAETLDSDLFNKGGAIEFLSILLLERTRKKYWKVQSKSTYKGKEIRQLSVGMRGTFYVCIKLATSPFIKPFVFDQPEDDLDNEFIVESLVPIFEKIKKYRQVIIVTHNANLVVNADAEQVIVAKNNDEVLSYESGAIENPAIREQICNILEGGEPAFSMREKKYGFVEI